MPAFRDEVGYAFRMGRFNAILKRLLGEHLEYGKITCHSFRCGLASLLAENRFSDEDIRAIGRWDSAPFMVYIKKPRLTRCRVVRKIGGSVIREVVASEKPSC